MGHGGVLCLGVRCGSVGSSVLLRKGKEEEEFFCGDLSVEEATTTGGSRAEKALFLG